MSDITLSSAVRSNLLSLQSTADLLSSTQNKLATGRDVNSALDNPTNFFTSSSLNSRSSDLSRLLDGISNATQTIEAADNGIEAITSLVESAQASARQALQTPGRSTVTELAGSTSATFDPTSNARVVGARGAGLGDLNADAGAADQITIANDRANAAVTLTGTIATVTDTSTDQLSVAGLADTDTLTIEIDDGSSALKTLNINFTATGTIASSGTGDSRTINVNVNQTVDTLTTEIAAQLDAVSGGTSVVNETGTGTAFTLVAENNAVESIRVTGDSVATLTSLGLQAQGTQVGANAEDRIITRNADLDALVGAGDTLSVGTVDPGTGNFTTTGTANFDATAGGVKTKAGLEAALNNGNIVDAASGTGVIDIDLANSTDARNSLRFVQGAGDGALAALGLGNDGGGLTDQRTEAASNLITQGAVDASESLTFTFGNDTAQTVNFGYGNGEVSSISELNQALSALTGGTASVRTTAGAGGAQRGDITIESDSPDDVVRINSTTGTAATFGLTTGEFSNLVGGTGAPLSQGDSISFQIGASPANQITFGTGANEVNTFNELQSALTNISGAQAEVDDQTGAITISSEDSSQPITFGESGGTIGDAFGLTAGVTSPVTTDSSTRANLETDFNELLSQIDELARDASFNGNNLLQSDDLTVIFNEDGSSSLDIDGVDFDTGGLGVNRITGLNTFQEDSNIETTLGQLDSAITALRDQAAQFGSNLSVVETRRDFTTNLINTLETGAANLVNADLNEEGANLLALQTRQQLSTTALSLSAQADQNVLRLF